MSRTPRLAVIPAALTCLALLVAVVAAQQKPAAANQQKPPAAKMSKQEQAMMDAMMKAAAPGENHKLLAAFSGNWTFVNRMWTDPSAKPTESAGSASFRMLLGGRYLQGEHWGTMMGMPFEGMSLNGYDNTARRFQLAWIDNMGTTTMYMAGTYDPAAKAYTYAAEMDDVTKPGTRVKVREVIRWTTPDQYVMEWYENRAGKETKTMEITYARKK